MRHRPGFTLIEILVVVAILGIVSSVVLAGLKGGREKANLAAAKGNLASLRSEMANIATVERFPAAFCPGGEASGGAIVPTTGAFPSSAVVRMSKGVEESGYVLKCAIPTPDAGFVNSWSAWFAHTSSGPYFCVDSNGFAGDRNTDPATASPSYTCPTT